MAATRFTKHPEACAAVLGEIVAPERTILATSNWKCFTEPYAYSHKDISKWTIPIDKEYLDTYIGALDYATAHLMLPGVEEYHRAFGREAVAYFQGKIDVNTALSSVETSWDQITERQGRQKQQAFWETYTAKLKRLGFRTGF
jgi:hypothetical protein